MCRYGTLYKTHFVCLPCRRSVKSREAPGGTRPCPRCGRPMIDAGRDLAVPRRRDIAGWRALAAVLAAGLRFHSCGCGGPGHRPRTPAAVRVRLEFAARTGRSPRSALALRDLED